MSKTVLYFALWSHTKSSFQNKKQNKTFGQGEERLEQQKSQIPGDQKLGLLNLNP